MSGGIIVSKPYIDIPTLRYDRKDESILLSTKDASGTTTMLISPS